MLEKLTPDQLDIAEVVRDRWLDFGLSTETADRPVAEEGIRLAYTSQGLKAPRIEWCDSPWAAKTVLTAKNQVTNDSAWGQHDAGWLAWCEFWCEIGILEKDTALGPRMIGQSANWWWPYEDYCLVSERPEVVQMEESGRRSIPVSAGRSTIPILRLHGEAGQAIRYRDGNGLYALHGIVVPENIVTRDYTSMDALNCENIEVRRVMIDRLGYDAFLEGAERVESDEWGTLWRVPLAEDEDLSIVEVLNSSPEPDGSYKSYHLRVPPTVDSVRGAIAWTFNMNEKEYDPAIMT